LPPEYSDFADVFLEKLARELPLLGGRIHAIKLELRKTPPWGLIYNLADTELRVLREYIDDTIAKG
jgi:hypothetical protein